MNFDQFLDVNGLNAEYNMPLEKRLNKYRTHDIQDSKEPVVSDAAIRAVRSERYAAKTKRRQVVIAIVAFALIAAAGTASYFLTYGLPA